MSAPPPSDTSSRTAVAAGAATTVALTGVLLWPAFGRGQLLYRDFVSVPSPVLGAHALGRDGAPARAVPLDAVTALAASVLPSGAVQQLLLAGSLLLAGIGMSVLLRRDGWVATVVAAALATWSPYAVERLLLGQPPTLLAWSALPWLVSAARWSGPTGSWLARVALAAAPAALTPFGGVAALAVVLVVAAWGSPLRRRPRQLLALLGLGLAWCLPWLLPTARGAGGATAASGDPDGAAAFAVAWDGWPGVLDLLGGGGVWASGATPASRGQLLAVVVSAVPFAVGLLVVGPGWRAVGGPGSAGVGAGAGSGRRMRALAAVALVLPVVGVLAASRPPLLDGLAVAQGFAPVALVRDTHRLLGLSVCAACALTGLAAAAFVRRGGVGLAVAMAGLSVAIAGVPDAATRLHAAYRPVEFPSGWAETVAAIGDRDVLVLPWQPFRQQDWVGQAPFLDPTALAVSGRATTARTLVVTRAGEDLVVADGDPVEAAAWADGRVEAAGLDAAGVQAVLEWVTAPGRLPTAHPGLRLAYDGPLWRVWVRDRAVP